MPNSSLAQKTLLAAACSLSLLACGQSAEPAAAPAAQPLAQHTDQLSGFAAGKISADSLAKQISAEPAQGSQAASAIPASVIPASAIPASAIAATPAASTIGAKGRQLVLTASARFSVKNTYTSALAIEDAVLANDGYVVSNHIASTTVQHAQHSVGDGQLVRVAQVGVSGEMVVRVPSHKAQAFLRDIASQIQTLEQRNFVAKDVQFDMLRSQLDAARGQETQAELGLLARQPGYVIEKSAVLEARGQAKASRDEARIAQAQLADQVAFSTIALGLHQPLQVRSTQEADFEAASNAHRLGFAAQLQRALAGGWHGLLSLCIGAAALWPLWLLLMAVGGAAVAYRARRNKKLTH